MSFTQRLIWLAILLVQFLAPCALAQGKSDALAPPVALANPKAELIFEKGHKCLDDGNLKGAEAYYRKAIAIDQTDYRFHKQLAIVLAKQRRLPEADREILIADSASPNNWRIMLLMGNIYHLEDRYDEETAVYKKILPLLPADQSNLRDRLLTFINKDEQVTKHKAEVARRKKELEEERYRDAY